MCPPPLTPRGRARASFAAPWEPVLQAQLRTMALPSRLQGSGAHWAPPRPGPTRAVGCSQLELDRVWESPGSADWLELPLLRTCPGLPAPAAARPRSPAPSQPPAAQPAPALSQQPGQMWGGLSRAIGLGHCVQLTSRIFPWLCRPLCGLGRERPGQASPLPEPIPLPNPSGIPSSHPWSSGFGTVVTPQTKQV